MTVYTFKGWVNTDATDGEADYLLGIRADSTGDDGFSVQGKSTKPPTIPFLKTVQEEVRGLTVNQVTIRYWTSNKASSKDEMIEGTIRELLGDAELDYWHRYSDITGYLWTDEKLQVGGHDVMKELHSHVGHYLYLEIEVHDE